MANLVQNYGLELPIYRPESKVAWFKSDFIKAAESGNIRFIRGVRACGYTSLKQTLDVADVELGEVCQSTGARLIGFNWGLYNLDGCERAQPSFYSDPHLNTEIPSGYALVAEVDVVKDTRDVSSEWNKIQADIDAYVTGRVEQGRPYLDDMSPLQIRSGRRFANLPLRQNWLIDIEPLLRK